MARMGYAGVGAEMAAAGEAAAASEPQDRDIPGCAPARPPSMQRRSAVSRPQEMADSPASGVPQAALEALRGALSGDALVDGDDDYDGARAVWNAMIDRRPAVIARCTSTADVIAAVGFARAHGLPASIRGGGHNVAGHAVCDGGVMIDLSAMRGVRVDPERRRAWVEGGATWRDVDRETQAFGARDARRPDLGHRRRRPHPERRHRLAAQPPRPEHRQPRVGRGRHRGRARRPRRRRTRGRRPAVGAQGRRRQLRRRHGVRVRAAPGRPDADVLRAALSRSSAGSGPIRFWRDFLADKSDDVGVAGRVLDDPGRSRTTRRSPGASGSTRWPRSTPATPTRASALLQPLRELGEPVVDFSGQMNYCDIQQLFDTAHPVRPVPCYWKSHYLSGLRDGGDRRRSSRATPRRRRPTRCRRSGTSAARRRASPRRTRPSATARCRTCSRSTRSGSARRRTTANIAWTRDVLAAHEAALRPRPHLPQLPGPRRGGRGARARASSARTSRDSRRSSGTTTRTTSSASTRTSDRAEPAVRAGWERPAQMSIVTRVLDLARGADAFEARDWSRARDLLRDAVSAEPSDEALEMLAVSSWWLDDGPTARLAGSVSSAACGARATTWAQRAWRSRWPGTRRSSRRTRRSLAAGPHGREACSARHRPVRSTPGSSFARRRSTARRRRPMRRRGGSRTISERSTPR